MGPETLSLGTVAIVTGGSTPIARDVARGLARWAWSLVIVYLDHQVRVEAVVAEIIAAGGVAVAVRADLEDDLDVHRLFDEVTVALGGVDVIAHLTAESASLLYGLAPGRVRRGGVYVSTTAAEELDASVASELRESGITVGRVTPREVLDFLSRWRPRTTG